MKIVKDMSGDYPGGTNEFLFLEEFSDNSEDTVFFYGIASTVNLELQEKYKNYKNRILLNLWSPCEIYAPYDELGHNFFQQHEYFTEVLTICPFTAEWANSFPFSNEKFAYGFYPIHRDMFPKNTEKKYDVCFVGGIHAVDHFECIQVMQKFSNRFISYQPYTEVTNLNVTNPEKMDIIAQCKIGICYNTCYLTNEQYKHALIYPGIENHKAFSKDLTYSNGNRIVIPQFKSRIHEFAMSKTLILCKKDNWNLIEDYYPKDCFLYFKDNQELEEIIRAVLADYDKFEQVIESAYNRVKSFTTEQLIKGITHGRHSSS